MIIGITDAQIEAYEPEGLDDECLTWDRLEGYEHSTGRITWKPCTV